MIKKFFAKLTNSWDQISRPDMKRSNTAEEIMRRDRELAKEREEMHKQNMRVKGFIPKIDVDIPMERPEKHDQAA